MMVVTVLSGQCLLWGGIARVLPEVGLARIWPMLLLSALLAMVQLPALLPMRASRPEGAIHSPPYPALQPPVERVAPQLVRPDAVSSQRPVPVLPYAG